MKSSRILATGCYVPNNIVTNDDLAKIVDTSDEWIQSRTGIKERRIADKEDLSIMCSEAAKNAITTNDIDPLSIDFIIVATTSPEELVPACATRVQASIGAKNAACFDIIAACPGLLFAMEIADKFLMSGAYQRGIIIGGEVLSKIVDWNDRNTCVLFGDGAGALVVEQSEKAKVKWVTIGSNGLGGDYLTCAQAVSTNPYQTFESDYKDKVVMDGKEVFKFAVTTMVKSVKDIMKNEGLTADDLKYIVCHQANLRIIELASKKLGISMDKFYVNLDKYGNTSSASIGIALDELVKQNELAKGDKLILTSFGGGLNWGSCFVEWDV